MESSLQAQIKRIYNSWAIYDGRESQVLNADLQHLKELCPHCKQRKRRPWDSVGLPDLGPLHSWVSGA